MGEYKSRNKSSVFRMSAFGTVLGGSLAFGAAAASAVEITVWSGYPEMVPFYEHVAEGMKEKHPDLTVKVEAIALREHEKRIALGLTSGAAAEVIELGTSTATRYLENGLFSKAPDAVAAFVTDPANFSEFFREFRQLRGRRLRRAAVPRPERALLQHRDVRGGRPDRAAEDDGRSSPTMPRS